MKIKAALPISLLIASGLTTFAGIDVSKLPAPAKQAEVTYAKDIKPLFEVSCVRCHGGERAKAGLHLDTLEGVMKGSKEGPVVVKGESAKSLLVEAVSQLDPETAMPPKRGGGRGPGGPGGFNKGGTNAPAGGPRPGGPGGGQPAKPLTPEQVALVRAWIDQGAK
jgi:hypothetical protein